MRYLLLLGVLGLVGCQNLVGPLQYKQPVRVDDPLLNIREQEKLGRANYAVPDDSPAVGPATATTPPNFYQN